MAAAGSHQACDQPDAAHLGSPQAAQPAWVAATTQRAWATQGQCPQQSKTRATCTKAATTREPVPPKRAATRHLRKSRTRPHQPHHKMNTQRVASQQLIHPARASPECPARTRCNALPQSRHHQQPRSGLHQSPQHPQAARPRCAAPKPAAHDGCSSSSSSSTHAPTNSRTRGLHTDSADPQAARGSPPSPDSAIA